MTSLKRIACLAALALACAPAFARPFPAKPIEIVVGGSAGGGWDTTARTIMKSLQDEKLVTVPISVLNKSGGSGAISWAHLNQHKGDGHYIAIFPSGQELMVALLGGHVDAISTGLSEIVEQHKAGKARILAISAPARLKSEMAALPTWNEQGVDGEFGHWRGLFGPKDMPADQLKAWEDVLGRMVKTKTWKQLIAAQGWDDAYLPGAKYKAYLEKEHEIFATTFREMGIARKK